MDSAYIFAVGKIDKGGHAVVITRQQAEECSGAYVMGQADAFAGKPCEPLQHYTALLYIESYCTGYADAQATNGTLQRLIDYGAEVQDLLDARDDEEFARWGGA